MNALGRHVLVEYYNCDPEVINNQELMQKYMIEAAKQSRATIVGSVFHKFNPHGISGVVVIAESHMAIHTWPEYNYAAVDLFTCGETVDPWVAFEYLKKKLKSTQYTTKELKRGLPDSFDKADQTIAYKVATNG